MWCKMLYHSAYTYMLRITVSVPLVTYFIYIHIIKVLFSYLHFCQSEIVKNKQGQAYNVLMSHQFNFKFFFIFLWPFIKSVFLAQFYYFGSLKIHSWKYHWHIVSTCQFHILVHVISFTHKSNRLISCRAYHWLNNKSFCLIVNEIICSTVSALVELPIMFWA